MVFFRLGYFYDHIYGVEKLKKKSECESMHSVLHTYETGKLFVRLFCMFGLL